MRSSPPFAPSSLADVGADRVLSLVPSCGRQRFPFTVIDQAFHLLDSPAEPWSIQVELQVSGHLDEQRLRSALVDALSAHPMARARQLPSRRTDRTWIWEIAPAAEIDPLRVVDCPDDAALAAVRQELYSRLVPLIEAPPFRLVLARRPAGDTLLLNANHAAFDGFGALRLLRSIAHAYTGLPESPPPVGLGEARDVHRHAAAGDRRERVRRFRMLAGMASDLVRRPTRLAVDGGTAEPGYGFHLVALTEEQTHTLTTHKESSVNELLLTALTLAIAGWNQEHGADLDRVGIHVPVNLRPKPWSDDVVTNMVLNAQVMTRAAQRTDRRATLRAVSEQNQRIRQGAGAALIEVIGGWTSLPLWAKQPLSALLWLTGNRLVPTAVLSNLGSLTNPPDFGSAAGRTGNVWFSSPARMPCGLAVGAVTTAGRLHLSLRYRHPLLGPAAAARFTDRFVTELDLLALT